MCGLLLSACVLYWHSAMHTGTGARVWDSQTRQPWLNPVLTH